MCDFCEFDSKFGPGSHINVIRQQKVNTKTNENSKYSMLRRSIAHVSMGKRNKNNEKKR